MKLPWSSRVKPSPEFKAELETSIHSILEKASNVQIDAKQSYFPYLNVSISLTVQGPQF